MVRIWTLAPLTSKLDFNKAINCAPSVTCFWNGRALICHSDLEVLNFDWFSFMIKLLFSWNTCQFGIFGYKWMHFLPLYLADFCIILLEYILHKECFSLNSLFCKTIDAFNWCCNGLNILELLEFSFRACSKHMLLSIYNESEYVLYGVGYDFDNCQVHRYLNKIIAFLVPKLVLEEFSKEYLSMFWICLVKTSQG